MPKVGRMEFNMRIAVVYICTGKYEKFWDRFYSSCEKNFYPNIKKDYFVFTESQRIIRYESENVNVYYQVKSGWPYDTLLRFQWFMCIQDVLKEYDYCYYFNANSELIGTVTSELIPLPDDKEPLIFWCHTLHYDDNYGETFHPERNSESTAYVPEGEMCRCYGGGFFGGTSEAFILMCKELRDNISLDMKKGIIAVWHDQSHIIKYGSCHAHKEVPRDLICQEEKNPIPGKCLIVFLAKDKNGGTDSLRGSGMGKRFRHRVIKIYGKLLDITSKFGMDKILRNVAKKFANRKEWYK